MNNTKEGGSKSCADLILNRQNARAQQLSDINKQSLIARARNWEEAQTILQEAMTRLTSKNSYFKELERKFNLSGYLEAISEQVLDGKGEIRTLLPFDHLIAEVQSALRMLGQSQAEGVFFTYPAPKLEAFKGFDVVPTEDKVMRVQLLWGDQAPYEGQVGIVDSDKRVYGNGDDVDIQGNAISIDVRGSNQAMVLASLPAIGKLDWDKRILERVEVVPLTPEKDILDQRLSILLADAFDSSSWARRIQSTAPWTP